MNPNQCDHHCYYYMFGTIRAIYGMLWSKILASLQMFTNWTHPAHRNLTQ